MQAIRSWEMGGDEVRGGRWLTYNMTGFPVGLVEINILDKGIFVMYKGVLKLRDK